MTCWHASPQVWVAATWVLQQEVLLWRGVRQPPQAGGRGASGHRTYEEHWGRRCCNELKTELFQHASLPLPCPGSLPIAWPGLSRAWVWVAHTAASAATLAPPNWALPLAFRWAGVAWRSVDSLVASSAIATCGRQQAAVGRQAAAVQLAPAVQLQNALCPCTCNGLAGLCLSLHHDP